MKGEVLLQCPPVCILIEDSTIIEEDGDKLRRLVAGEAVSWGKETQKSKMVGILQRISPIWEALRDLLPYEGLWKGKINLGNLSNLASMKGSQKELVNYLRKIKLFWSSLHKEQPAADAPTAADSITVSILHHLCPQTQDRVDIENENASLFQDLDEASRKFALEAVLSTKFVKIPNLLTFCDDAGYLGAFSYNYIP